MTTKEKKERLIKRIESINDDSIIDEVYSILKNQDGVIVFDKEQEDRIALSRASIANGDYKSNEQIKEEVAMWLRSI